MIDFQEHAPKSNHYLLGYFKEKKSEHAKNIHGYRHSHPCVCIKMSVSRTKQKVMGLP